MMSHGQSFKTNSETYSTCVGDHKDESMHCTDGILVSCSEPLGLTKEKIYSVLLGQSLKKSSFISEYSSYKSLVSLNILKYSHVYIWYWRLILLSLDAFLIAEMEKQNRRKWLREEKPHFIQS